MWNKCLGLLLCGLAGLLQAAEPVVLLPNHSLQASQLAVIVNDSDALSVAIADYYQQRRQIPPQNMIHVQFEPNQSQMHPGEFAVLQRVVESRLPEGIQAFALTWAAPYRVGCMSMTSAFAFGYDPKYCSQKRCGTTAVNPYAGGLEYRDLRRYPFRPAMMIAADSLGQARALIDRGVAADHSWPRGGAYLVTTQDKARNVRRVRFPLVAKQLATELPIHLEETEAIAHRQDVMFYFTGRTFVDDLDTNRYLPGAIADHLTSAGGQLTDSRQMSALRWLEAGATGSYGTVVEPCNLLQKFPDPLSAINAYLNGATLIEAYWRSVLMPGEGLFIGEPLAQPYGGYRLKASEQGWQLYAPQLREGYYNISALNDGGQMQRLESGVKLSGQRPYLLLRPPYHGIYQIEPFQLMGRSAIRPW
jgi:uncharacterized protein (TIGR03790 family)